MSPANPHPPNAVGHQGLFFDRFDALPTASPLAPEAEGLYYNRNRHYAPVLGRFLQRDPNETGQETLGLFYDGQAPGIFADGFNLEGLFGNGMGLHAYLGSSPVSTVDPSGLMFTIAEQGQVQGASAGLDATTAAAVGGGILGAVALLSGQIAGYNAVLDIATQNLDLALDEGFDIFNQTSILVARRILEAGGVFAGIRLAQRILSGDEAEESSGDAAAHEVDIQRGKHHRKGKALSKQEAIEEVRNGGDVIARNKSTARDIAEAAGDGRPVHNTPHETGQRPHYHPTQGGKRGPGHVLY